MTTELDAVTERAPQPLLPEKIGWSGVPVVDKGIQPNNVPATTLPQTLRWSNPIQAGGCVCFGANLTLYPNGNAVFDCHLNTENPGHDSWGILHFDLYQANGVDLWRSGQFWSPTIHTGGGPGQDWTFQFGYPAYIFNDLFPNDGPWGWASFTYHC